LEIFIKEETAAVEWTHVSSQSNPADLISRGIQRTTLSTSTLWWKRPQWLKQQPSTWPTTEVNTYSYELEVRNLHVAILQTKKGISSRFSKLYRLIRVIAYCKRFTNNCRTSKANRHTITLSSQDLGQALTCCVKMAQQISYSQEIKEVGEKQEFAAKCTLNTLHPFPDKNNILRVGGR